MEKKILTLRLKKKWFDMTASGVKTEDYRKITPYWCARLLLYNGKHQKEAWWKENFFDGKSKVETVRKIMLESLAKEFDETALTLGYPAAGDTDRILRVKTGLLRICPGRVEWGAEKDEVYFVIGHGEIIR